MIGDWHDAKHELLVWIWYPANPAGAVRADYVPASMRGPRNGLFGLLTKDLARVPDRCFRDAVAAPGRFPVVIFRAGASAEVVKYSTVVEDLASHGYVVIGFDAPYRTSRVAFPDGRVFVRTAANNPELVSGAALQRMATRLIGEWDDDIAFALARAAQLPFADTTRVAAFGHSFGGATALQFCRGDARCQAVVDIDGEPVITTAIGKPVLFILSDHHGEPDAPRVTAQIRSLGGRIVTIPGASHFTFSDDGAFVKSSLLRGVLRLFGKLRIEPREQIAITTRLVHEFFDQNLGHTG